MLGRVDDVGGDPQQPAPHVARPPGRRHSGVSEPISPLADSLTVPSPQTRQRLVPLVRGLPAQLVACPALVSTAVTS